MAQRLNIDIVARDKASKALNGLRGGLSKVRSAVFNLQNAFLGLGAGLVVRNLVNTGKELENLQVRLKFLLKNTQEGTKAFDNMVKFASKVPFSLEEIQAGSGILATVTDNATDLQKMLEITGNVAAVTGLDFRTTAEQIQRSFSAGIGAADLFREKGVRNMLGFQAGAEVSITQTVEAFDRVFGKKGRFGKATDELADTFAGTLSMIGDKIFSFKKTILEAGFFAGLKAEFGDINKFLDKNSEQIDELAKKIGIALADAVIALKNGFLLLKENADKVFFTFKLLIALPIATTLIKITTALMGLTRAMLKFNIATTLTKRGLVGLGMLLVQGGALFAAFKGIDKLLEEVSESFDNLTEKAKEFEHELSVAIPETFSNAVIIAREFEHEMSIAIPSATQKAIRKFEELNNTALENLKLKVSDIRMTIADGLNAGITRFSQSLSRAILLGEDLGKSFKRLVQDALVQTLSILIEIGIRMALQKLFGIDLENQELKQLDVMKKKTSELKKQVALQAMLLAMGGGGGGGSGFKLPFFNKGGAVSKGKPVVVGESGAELFIPNQTGQITQSARGTGGNPVNVNFTINAVDASGIDRLLVERRGTISRIINESVNERGSSNLI